MNHNLTDLTIPDLRERIGCPHFNAYERAAARAELDRRQSQPKLHLTLDTLDCVSYIELNINQ